jgi:hypothetical protein
MSDSNHNPTDQRQPHPDGARGARLLTSATLHLVPVGLGIIAA